MKKLLVLVSCFAVLLFLGTTSFVAEADEVETSAPVLAPAVPFVQPAFDVASGARPGAVRRATRAAQRSAPAPVYFVAPPSVAPPSADVPDLHLGDSNKVHQRVAVGTSPTINFMSVVRLAPRSSVPVVEYADGVDADPTAVSLPQTRMGDSNRVQQRSRVNTAPTINFMSVVRGPHAYDPYMDQYHKKGYPLPGAAE